MISYGVQFPAAKNYNIMMPEVSANFNIPSVKAGLVQLFGQNPRAILVAIAALACGSTRKRGTEKKLFISRGNGEK